MGGDKPSPEIIALFYEILIGMYPLQVGLVSPGEKIPYCGGSIITSRHILTAAHCSFDGNINEIKKPASIQVFFNYQKMLLHIPLGVGW